MPACLVECGFMDAPADVPIILTDDFARKCALGIAEGVVAVAGGSIQETSQPQQQDNSSDKKYYVQVGAYTQKENAEKQLQRAKDTGFSDAFIKQF